MANCIIRHFKNCRSQFGLLSVRSGLAGRAILVYGNSDRRKDDMTQLRQTPCFSQLQTADL